VLLILIKFLERLDDLLELKIRSGRQYDWNHPASTQRTGASDTSTSYLSLFIGDNPNRPTLVYRYDPT
jgi:hypothetical protein